MPHLEHPDSFGPCPNTSPHLDSTPCSPFITTSTTHHNPHSSPSPNLDHPAQTPTNFTTTSPTTQISAPISIPNLDASPTQRPPSNPPGIITRSKNNIFKANKNYVNSTSTGSKPKIPKIVCQALQDPLWR